jgi:hydrogenase maturation protein HypF
MRERLRFAVRGAVQGVGFRPFVYRLAHDLGLDGWVRNSTSGVFIEVEGQHAQLEVFRTRLASDRPPRAVIQSLEASWLDAAGHAGFEILESARDSAISALVLPDIAICEDCRRDIADRSNRRYRYPFTNCTNCGPRFSIIEALPYDRANTSMRRFEMCPACRREYDSPLDRRFHAQPNACPACGPQVALWDDEGHVLARADDALRAAAEAIGGGRIVAVKGLGGFHLMVDARDDAAVRRLRERKHREEKPFAVMCPDMDSIERHCVISTAEVRVLASPESPIVLCERRRGAQADLAESVAPGNPNLGVMLPYTPLHLVLMGDIGGPVVATSGNLSDEPICTDEREAIRRLRHIADVFLVHDRPIVRHVDDSIVRMMLDRELVVRRARGYAPLPIPLTRRAPTLLAVGAHLKSTVAASSGSNVFVSQHIGDLESAEASGAFVRVIADFQTLYGLTPDAVVADLHPDYRSTRHARSLGLPMTQVQHHFAHVAACMTENDLAGMNPGDEGVLVNIYRAPIQQVFIGIHMAGPKLTSETFKQGTYNYPRTGGTPYAPLAYVTKKYPTQIKDFVEVFFGANVSGKDERGDEGLGMMMKVAGGKRYEAGQWPRTNPNVFNNEGAIAIGTAPPAQGPWPHEQDGHKHNTKCMTC